MSWGFLVSSKYDVADDLREVSRLRRFARTLPLPKADSHLAPSIVSCGRVISRDATHAEVRVGDGRAWYAHVVHCKRPWDCPYCSMRLSQLRGRGVRKLNDAALGRGMRMLMVTFTFSHHKGAVLKSLLDAFTEALESMRRGRAWGTLKKRHGLLGFVRGHEVTYGANGWHPHCHEIWYMSGDVDVAQLREDVRAAYAAALAKVGLSASDARGVDVVESDAQIAAYVSKFGRFPRWDPSKEVSNGRRKGGKKGYTPWQLLALAAAGDASARDLFVEYSHAYKGVRQLYLSRGLVDMLIGPDVEFKELVSPEELLDEDGGSLLVGEDGKPLPPAYVVAVRLSQFELNCLFRLGLDGELLVFALSHSPDECREFVSSAVAQLQPPGAACGAGGVAA